ncbi:ExbD/TolR family protein [Rhizosphaericola mali]|uniref:Biopolymer transporter ExbD n=1 Tax=Rhizosphaericola mali TaxID=2545455 RepID=A0A5P2G4L2_9BACT|nr:biopolymer transporter ExbD [Rhizosphaericola mali]QES90766.1 biopolymer transporter ExbD [Rhizosphaericola mali]
MNLRSKRGAKRKAEVQTGALNDILFILLLFFLIVSTLANPNVIKVNNPKAHKDTKVKQNVVVSIDKDQKIYIGQTQVPENQLDSLIKMSIEKSRVGLDTPSVVINADTISYYGEVFRIMQSAKKAGARVVANVH